MNSSNATILVAVVASAGLHLIVDVREHGRRPDQYRIGLAALILAAFLLLMAEVWPTGARGLALTILLTSIVMNGQEFFALVISLVSEGKGTFNVR